MPYSYIDREIVKSLDSSLTNTNSIQKDQLSFDILSTNELQNMKVFSSAEKSEKVGNVSNIVFHPSKKKVVGIVIRRPDIAMMFKRADLFVGIHAFYISDDCVVLKNVANPFDKSACKQLGVNWDDCIYWIGFPMMTKGEKSVGTVGCVNFVPETGDIVSVEADEGTLSRALLGVKEIPAEYILGFRRGIGVSLRQDTLEQERYAHENPEQFLGAILIDEEALSVACEGGLAQKAGSASVVMAKKASEVVEKTGEVAVNGANAVIDRVGQTKDGFVGFKDEFSKEMEDIKKDQAEEEQKVIEEADEVTVKATRAVKTHLKKSKGMFGAFRDEFKKANK